MKKIIIVGGGPVGSLCSIFMARRGIKADVYEKRPDIRKGGVEAGRSINLVLSDRGWKALEETGISSEIKKITVPVYGRMIHDEQGHQSYLPYSIEKRAIYSVSRGTLNARLMDFSEQKHGVLFHFRKKCTGLDLANAKAVFEDEDSGEITEAASGAIIGADGAFSQVRQSLQRERGFNCSQEVLGHGYKELVIPAHHDGRWKLEKNALHIWPRKKYMLMALANLDGSFTCTLFFPARGIPSFETIRAKDDLLGLFNEVFPDVVPLMPSLVDDYFANPPSSLAMVRCMPWTAYGKAVLIGDAAHAIVPFYGEGMNCGFEDCTALDRLIGNALEKRTSEASSGKSPDAGFWKPVFEKFQQIRKPNADAIADLSLQNFIEMRDRVADPRFLLRKKIEAKLHKKHPGKWTPLYTLVKFSDIPYAEVLKAGKRQDEIMEKVLNIAEIEKKWDSDDVENFILKLL